MAQGGGPVCGSVGEVNTGVPELPCRRAGRSGLGLQLLHDTSDPVKANDFLIKKVSLFFIEKFLIFLSVFTPFYCGSSKSGEVVCVCMSVHARKIQTSKVLLEIINILLIFSNKIHQEGAVKTKLFSFKSWFANLHITIGMYNIC